MSLAWLFSLAYTIFSKVLPTALPEPVVTGFSFLFLTFVLLFFFQKFSKKRRKPLKWMVMQIDEKDRKNMVLGNGTDYYHAATYSLMAKLALARLLENQTIVLISLPSSIPARPVCIVCISTSWASRHKHESHASDQWRMC
jgi:hypothetical protein